MNFNLGHNKMKETGTDISENKFKSTPIAMVAPEMKQSADNWEISKTCAVLGCEDSKTLGSEEFFTFPEDPYQRQIWTDLTGRSNWTPTDYSYICIQHFSVDCFECNADNQVVLTEKAVPSLRLPRHVLEVEYIDEETLENGDDDGEFTDGDYESDANIRINGTSHHNDEERQPHKYEDQVDEDLLMLFTEVQMMQRQTVGLRDKVKFNTRMHNKQKRHLNRLEKIIQTKNEVLNQKRKRKAKILLSLQDKIKEDTNGLVMAMPTRHTDDMKDFALSIYKYSPQAYVYIRNTLRTMLPSTDILDSWVSMGHIPKNLLSSSNLIKVSAEQTDTELSCKISLC